MIRKTILFLVAGAMILSVTQTKGAVTLVTSRSGLGGTDSINWGLLGNSFTSVPNPFVILSNGGLPVTVSQAGGNFERRDEVNGSWGGNFSPGDRLLWTDNFDVGGGGPITIDFGSSSLTSFGLQIQADFLGAFTAQLQVNDGSNSTVTENGYSSGSDDGSAIFIGVSSSVPFSQIIISLLSANNNLDDFAVNQADFIPAGSTPSAPEVPSVAIWGVFAAFGGCIAWRSRK